MMDGEQLLTRLKDGANIDPLLHEIESYFMPVSKTKRTLNIDVSNKYGVFAMKAMRACIQRLTDTKPGSRDLAGILQISEKSYQCVCTAREHIKTIPLALEKLLFHTMMQTLNKRLLSDAQRVATFLYNELSKSRSEFVTAMGVDNEYDTIIKQAFNKLWKACVDMEQSSQAEYALKHALILDIRLQALQFLVLTDYECSWVVERALRAAVDFDRKSCKSTTDQEQLHTFLMTVLDLLVAGDCKASKAKEQDASDRPITKLFELGLQAIKYSFRSLQFQQALEICNKLEAYIQQPRNKDDVKLDTMYRQCLLLIQSSLQVGENLSLSNVSSKSGKNKTNSSDSHLDTSAVTIQSIASNISKVMEKSTISGSSLMFVLEACELLKKSLEGSTHSQQQKTPSGLPEVLKKPVYSIITVYVDLLQAQKEQLSGTSVTGNRAAVKSLGQQIQRNVNRQLNTLDFLATMMLDKIKACNHDDSTEVKGYLAKAINVCCRTKTVIDGVATGDGGALPAEEYRWFGSSAYNLGVVCYKMKCYSQAASVLDIACQQLQTWCFAADKVDLQKIKKVQLLTRYELLIDCHRKASQYTDAMDLAVKCLWQVGSHVTDQVTPCIELWVKAKRDAVKNGENEEIQSQTLFDAIKDTEGNLIEEHRGFISLLLNKELQAYKALRHDTTVEEHSVVCDLLSLNSGDDTKLAYCHALVEQAQLLRIGNFESDKSACECCSEAIDILTEISQESSTSDSYDNPQDLVVFDVLAIAYFWMYVCQMEEAQLNTAKIPKSKSETKIKSAMNESGVVAHVAYNLGMETKNMKYLDMAMDIWADLLSNSFRPDVFHDLGTSRQCLKLMASLYGLTQRPLQQLQSLRLLLVLSTASGNTLQSVYAFCELSRVLCHMGETQLAGDMLGKADELVQKVDDSDSTCRSLQMSCMLAKAEYLLYHGQFDRFQSNLEKLLQSQMSDRHTYHTYLKNAHIKQLQSTCMDVSSQVLTLNPEGLTSLELAVEAMRIHMGVCSSLLGEHFCNSQQQPATNTSNIDSSVHDESYDQWSILSAVLGSLLQVGKMYCQQGTVREAECYLHEGLIIANQYLLPRRCAEFSLQLSKVYTMKGQQCQAQLNQMKQFVDCSTETNIFQPQALGKGTEHSNAVKIIKNSCKRNTSRNSIADNSDEENFIQTKRMSLTDILSGDNVASSPTLKAQTIKLPVYHKHASDCGCQSCSDIVLHQWDLDYFAAQARSSLMQGELLEALDEVDTAMQLAIWIVARDNKIVLDTLKSCDDKEDNSSNKTKKTVKPAAARAPGTTHIHDLSIVELHTLKIQVLLQQNKPMKAQQCIDKALAMFSKDVSPVLLPAVNKAELQFYQVIIGLSRQGCDVYTGAWKHLQNQSDMLLSQVDDLSLGMDKLDLSQDDCHKPSVVWQDRLKDIGRPELARKDLVTPAAQVLTSGGIGIFCDPSDEDDSSQHEGASAIVNTPKPASSRCTSIKANTKKGVFSYSVKKKEKTVKTITMEEQFTGNEEKLQHSQEPVSAFNVDHNNDVFGFDSPSVTSKKRKPTKKTKSAKTAATTTKSCNRKTMIKSRQKSKPMVTFEDSDVENNDQLPKSCFIDKDISVFLLDNDSDFEHGNRKSKPSRKNTEIEAKNHNLDCELDTAIVNKKTARKKSTASRAKKKPAFILSESDAEQTDEQSDIFSRKNRQSRKKCVSDQDGRQEIKQKDLVVKPKGRPRVGKKLSTPNETVEQRDFNEIIPKKTTRRGRKPNIENARVENEELVLSCSNMLEVNGILPVDSSDDISDMSCHSYADLDISYDVSNDIKASISYTVSPVKVTVSSAVSDMLFLDDVEEIEIPRAVPSSDDEEHECDGRRKVTVTKKSTGSNGSKKKKATGSRRATKKSKEYDDEDEILRASTHITEQLSSKPRSKKTLTIKKVDATLSESGRTTVIGQLEQVYNTIKQSAPMVLYRQVCHMLALCYGDKEPLKAVHYLNEAMSVTLRHKKISSLTKKIKKIKKASASSDMDQLSDNMASMLLVPDNNKKNRKITPSTKQASPSDLDFLEKERMMFVFHDVSSGNSKIDIVQETVDRLPEGWTICMLSVVSPCNVYSTKIPADSDFLVVSRLAQGKHPVLLKLPMCKSDFGFGKSCRDIMDEFDTLMLQNKESTKETDKRAWWSHREKLDDRMEALTRDMESCLFGCWKGVLLGQDKKTDQRKKLNKAAKELKTVVEATSQIEIDQHLCECLLASANKLSKQHLSTAISCVSGLKSGSDEHTALMTIFRQLATKLAHTSKDADQKHPVVLILDKQIQQLPWENMPSLKTQPVCRMPSLHLIHSHLRAMYSKDSVLSRGVDSTNTFFVLNPTDNLANTQKTFQKWFEKDNGWNGVVARAPSKEEYMSALTDHDLFVYCGHGNGREFLTGDDTQRLNCQAATLLIGCSSGKLHVNGCMEACGMALNYLVAGCPCVVANLWDVTDRDIDRFLEDLLKSWLASSKTTSLPDYINQARQTCKLQYLIGCAPVVYGLPVYIKQSN